MSSEPSEAVADILRATLSLVEHYGSDLEQTATLCNLRNAIECVLVELDPEGEKERRRIEALGTPPPHSVQNQEPESARRDISA